jgi:hypothetical protein
MQYKEVRVKDLDRHAIEALLVSRALPVKIKRDIENQIRGLLENLGLVIGQAKMKLKRQPISATTRSIAPLRSERGMSPAPHEPRLSIGIDTSGTFTDIVAVDGSAGTMRVSRSRARRPIRRSGSFAASEKSSTRRAHRRMTSPARHGRRSCKYRESQQRVGREIC